MYLTCSHEPILHNAINCVQSFFTINYVHWMDMSVRRRRRCLPCDLHTVRLKSLVDRDRRIEDSCIIVIVLHYRDSCRNIHVFNDTTVPIAKTTLGVQSNFTVNVLKKDTFHAYFILRVT